MEYYSGIKRSEVLTYARIWLNLENMLSEKSQAQKTIHCMIPFICVNVQHRQIYRDRK